MHLLEKRPHVSGDLVVVSCAVARGNCLSSIDAPRGYYVLRAGPELSGSDIDRGSARADVDPSASRPIVLLRFSAHGRRAFQEVTRRLAERGRRLCGGSSDVPRCAQHLAIVVKREIVSIPHIDFALNPNGIPGETGVQFEMPSMRDARALARDLNAP
jgi:preprotein translocase subunit SecD